MGICIGTSPRTGVQRAKALGRFSITKPCDSAPRKLWKNYELPGMEACLDEVACQVTLLSQEFTPSLSLRCYYTNCILGGAC